MRSVAAVLVLTTFTVAAYEKPRPPVQPRLVESLTPPLATAGSGDTVWFGGTTWMPDSMRWEAIRDSVWTFETGVGSWINTGQLPGKPIGFHGGMEGWAGAVPDGFDRGRFARSTTCAISGAWSLWAGLDSVQAHCYATGQGYGNSWGVARYKTFAYPGSGGVTLSFDYAVESEPGFDYGYVAIDTTGTGTASYITLRTWTGTTGGHEIVNLTQSGGTLPSSAGNITVRFLADSDGSYSDEDGLFPTTCGLLAVDNITLAGAVVDVSDFESADDGWGPAPEPPPGTGDLSHLAAIADLPPMLVPGPCSVQDSVLVFHDASFEVPDGWCVAVSPWIDLKRNQCVGTPGKLLSYDLYTEYQYVPNGAYPWLTIMIWSNPVDPCEGRQVIQRPLEFGPWCSSAGPRLEDLSSLISPDAEQVRIAVGIDAYVGGFFVRPGSTPWFDNIRFGVYGTPVGVPETPQPPSVQLSASPNPLRTSTRISFTAATSGHVQLTVYDVAGRLVRTLLDEAMPAGTHNITWDATDDAGQRVATGLYFYRATAADFTAARKLVVIE